MTTRNNQTLSKWEQAHSRLEGALRRWFSNTPPSAPAVNTRFHLSVRFRVVRECLEGARS